MPRKGENIYKRKDGRWEGRFIKSYNDYVISESGKAFVDRSYCNTTSLRSSKKRLLKKQITMALRHTFATRCVEAGFEIKSLSEILGHANVSITPNKYVHASVELKEKNMNLLTL